MDRCNGNNLLDEQCYLPLDRCNGKTQDEQSYIHLTDVMGKDHMMSRVIFTWFKNYFF